MGGSTPRIASLVARAEQPHEPTLTRIDLADPHNARIVLRRQQMGAKHGAQDKDNMMSKRPTSSPERSTSPPAVLLPPSLPCLHHPPAPESDMHSLFEHARIVNNSSCDDDDPVNACTPDHKCISSDTERELRLQLDSDADAFATMSTYKTERCTKTEPHDHLLCMFVHDGECARRNPFKFSYAAKACPELRKRGVCGRGDACPFAHGVLEVGLHPSRYRTHMCSLCDNGQRHCGRPVCFFAHNANELREVGEESAARKEADATSTRILHQICTAHRTDLISKESRDSLRSLVGRGEQQLAIDTLTKMTARCNSECRWRLPLQFAPYTSGAWTYAVSLPLTPLGVESSWKTEMTCGDAVPERVRAAWD